MVTVFCCFVDEVVTSLDSHLVTQFLDENAVSIFRPVLTTTRYGGTFQKTGIEINILLCLLERASSL